MGKFQPVLGSTILSYWLSSRLGKPTKRKTINQNLNLQKQAVIKSGYYKKESLVRLSKKEQTNTLKEMQTLHFININNLDISKSNPIFVVDFFS